ncbi:hypothetical protein Rhe02_33970 [Rhizocola hellebori]|uniref:Uncharacterized protein n=1 Tax=Rhizocola hellebori TaxID=1392758 RepID=A0A8J3Q956_9ACTN|nr:hypothetical protein Rhe02_33970 [Rhizocola hellebori]
MNLEAQCYPRDEQRSNSDNPHQGAVSAIAFGRRVPDRSDPGLREAATDLPLVVAVRARVLSDGVTVVAWKTGPLTARHRCRPRFPHHGAADALDRRSVL